MKRLNIPALWAAGAALLSVSMMACARSSETAAPSTTAASDAVTTAQPMRTLTVTSTAIPDYLELSAHIEPDPTSVVHVYPQMSGRITRMAVRTWDHVEQGQTLAWLESGDLARARADYQKAKADDEVKQKQLARAADLVKHDAIAQKDYQQAQADAAMASAEAQATRDHLRVLGADPETPSNEVTVVAPRAGVILDVGAASGEWSKSLDAPQPLCTIADLSTIWALGDVYERDLHAITRGQPADVILAAYPDRRWSGRVAAISDSVDPATRTVRVRVVLENPDGRIKPAMFGQIHLLRSESKGILVPAAAVIREGEDAYVFVPQGPNTYTRRAVTLGRTFDGSLEIVTGLHAGDVVVVEGALLLRAGAGG